jgi:hypothetical protein
VCTEASIDPGAVLATEAALHRERHTPARRFTVSTVSAVEPRSVAPASTFRSDAPGGQGVLTAKLAEFK